ncbi:MAG: pantetheine-phosphate adenylyltransferase [Sandaracinaceae bacterium]|nr:pantetheine-phosphate adenylyltransferase [Sandaracinaceae bacterium]MCC6874341.1 pantetheine-phosphate adenylyltransferase [Sandaracinaceae bacterium]
MTVAIYPGSFDPITNGHVSIIRSGLVCFDRMVVAVLRNPKKQSLFSVEERVEIIREELASEPAIEVDSFDGLLVDYCRRKGIRVVLRGLRAVADFEYELQMANMNRHLNEEVETVFIMANDAYFYVSSNIVKEAAMLGGDVSQLVPASVAKRLSAKLGR